MPDSTASASAAIPIQSADLLAEFEQRLVKRSLGANQIISAERWAFRKRAAVLTFFRPAELTPYGFSLAFEPAHIYSLLQDDIIPAPGMQGGWFMLKAAVRREALLSLSHEEMQRALAESPGYSRTPFQELYERWIAGRPPELATQSLEELTWAAQIAEWLDEIVPDLPSVEQVRRARDRRSVYALFSHLATDTYTGRDDELEKLRAFIGVPSPTSYAEKFIRRVRFGSNEALVIEGKGGIGKSAIAARLLNDYFNADPAVRFPFAYLALDNPVLKIEEPFTFAIECVRQLELLEPDHAGVFEDFRAALSAYHDERLMLDHKSGSVRTRGGRVNRLNQVQVRLFNSFTNVINRLCDERDSDGPSAPLLFILDTFEEAIFQGAERLVGLFELLKFVQKNCPTFRLLILTRSPFLPQEEFPFSHGSIVLEELEKDESVNLLRRLGVKVNIAERVGKQIGGNPLNLHLAARVLKSEQAGSHGIEGLKTSSYLLFSVSDEIIRGQLYARLLHHISDHRVRSLAHPGMVLRRINPELVLHVLRGPCKVLVEGIDDATTLCDELGREHTLVQTDANHGLRFRPDIRVPVLRTLQQDRPKQVREIHLAAISYYRGREKPADQAEALYHELALDESINIGDDHWRSDFKEYLGSAMEELPARSQAWLAAHMGFDISPELRKNASLKQWETITGRRVRGCLRYGRYEEAISYLGERTERTANSPLFAYEAKALLELNRSQEARAALLSGVESMQDSPSRGRLAELFWMLSLIAEQQKDFTQADEFLTNAQKLAAQIADPLCLLQILVQRLLLRRNNQYQPDGSEAIRRKLAEHLATISDVELDQERSLGRAAVTLLGPSYTELFATVLKTVGFGEYANSEILPWLASFGGLETADAVYKLFQERAKPHRSSPDPIEKRLEYHIQRSSYSKFKPEGIQETPDVALLVELLGEFDSLDGVLWAVRSGKHLTLLPLLGRFLDSLPLSLTAANLAGIDEYRESWESEIASEAV